MERDSRVASSVQHLTSTEAASISACRTATSGILEAATSRLNYGRVSTPTSVVRIQFSSLKMKAAVGQTSGFSGNILATCYFMSTAPGMVFSLWLTFGQRLTNGITWRLHD